MTVSWQLVLLELHDYSRYEDAQGDDGLAQTAALAAFAGTVIRSLRREGRQPQDRKQGIDGHHCVRLGEPSGTRPSRSHYEIYPGWYCEETLGIHCQQSAQFRVMRATYNCKGPAISAVDLRIICSEDGDLETPGREGEENLHDVQAQFVAGDLFGIPFKRHHRVCCECVCAVLCVLVHPNYGGS